ncbi:MAG: chemotaxis protein CheW [Alphaproteobacteria bacterium]|jgi:purine-binding chemotaxis protein CheW|nr:chemotaxis protein CheW [Alphaproteobacteria bacterium]
MTANTNEAPRAGKDKGAGESADYVTMTIAGQMFGIPVLQVQDVLGPQKITRIPLAPVEVAGSLNLRGRIVTAIDVRLRLGLPARERSDKDMSIVVDQGGELYSLMVDGVGEVVSVRTDQFERNPATLDAVWREVSTGIFRLNDKLLVVLDVARLLDFATAARAA